jgi:hypothetical protein
LLTVCMGYYLCRPPGTYVNAGSDRRLWRYRAAR